MTTALAAPTPEATRAGAPAPLRSLPLALTAAGGLLGAVLLFLGDLLLYGHLGSGAGFATRHLEVIAGASTPRLQLGGVLGPLGAIFYLLGALHVRQRLLPARPALRETTFAAFVALFVSAGAVHAVWGTHALVLRAAAGGQATAAMVAESRAYLGQTYRVAEVVGYPAAVLLFLLVASGRTTWPRWTAALNPGILSLAEPLAVGVPAPLGAVVVGSVFNLSFVLFFTISLLTLPRSPDMSDTR